jgi:hypothetical protein
MKQGPEQKHAIVKGGLAKRTSPGSHHGKHELSPEHVKGNHATSIVFPNAGGALSSGAFPETNTATVCYVARSLGDRILHAQNASDGRYIDWWFDKADWILPLQRPPELSQVPWSVVCASVVSEQSQNMDPHDEGTFHGVSMHAGAFTCCYCC